MSFVPSVTFHSPVLSCPCYLSLTRRYNCLVYKYINYINSPARTTNINARSALYVKCDTPAKAKSDLCVEMRARVDRRVGKKRYPKQCDILHTPYFASFFGQVVAPTRFYTVFAFSETSCITGENRSKCVCVTSCSNGGKR